MWYLGTNDLNAHSYMVFEKNPPSQIWLKYDNCFMESFPVSSRTFTSSKLSSPDENESNSICIRGSDPDENTPYLITLIHLKIHELLFVRERWLLVLYISNNVYHSTTDKIVGHKNLP